MKIALIQDAPIWENIEKNIERLNRKIQELSLDVDLLVLPEMFSTGFSMKPEDIAESESGKTVQWMIEIAKNKQIAVTGSLIIKDQNKYYNRLFFVFPDGSYKTYNKKHLFSLAKEDEIYESGNEKLIVSYKDWKVCLLICYDLRFPVFSRITENSYDLLIYVASWPDQRIYAWDSLLKARAIENMSYVIGVNRSGEDPFKNLYSGHSQVLDYFGKYVLEPMIDEQIGEVIIDKVALYQNREKFAFLNDADKFEIL